MTYNEDKPYQNWPPQAGDTLYYYARDGLKYEITMLAPSGRTRGGFLRYRVRRALDNRVINVSINALTSNPPRAGKD